jgi:hypothetical protein
MVPLAVFAPVLLGILEFIERDLLGIKDEFSLIMLGLKIVVLLFIVSFVRGRFAGGAISTILVFVLGYVILFQNWMLFGPLMIIYLLVVFGFTAILIDLVIIKPWAGGGGMGSGGDKPPDHAYGMHGRF